MSNIQTGAELIPHDLSHLGFLACFFFNDTATTEIYTLSLHDALPISNHFKVAGAFTVSDGRVLGVLRPAKKFYPQEQSPIAYVDYRLGLREDIYLVLGDFARDGSRATVKLQVNRLLSWILIRGVGLTAGAGPPDPADTNITAAPAGHGAGSF